MEVIILGFGSKTVNVVIFDYKTVKINDIEVLILGFNQKTVKVTIVGYKTVKINFIEILLGFGQKLSKPTILKLLY